MVSGEQCLQLRLPNLQGEFKLRADVPVTGYVEGGRLVQRGSPEEKALLLTGRRCSRMPGERRIRTEGYRKQLRRAVAEKNRALRLAAEAIRLMTDDQLVQLRDSLTCEGGTMSTIAEDPPLGVERSRSLRSMAEEFLAVFAEVMAEWGHARTAEGLRFPTLEEARRVAARAGDPLEPSGTGNEI